MFDVEELWPDTWEHPNRHTMRPPRPVTIDLGAILPPDPSPELRPHLPMRVTHAGLRLTGHQAGELHAWARITDGRWLALIHLEIPVAAGHGILPMLQWVPATAVHPTDQ